MTVRTLLHELVLPYESLRTLHLGGSEVRLYRNNVTGADQVGKRLGALGHEEAVAVQEATLLQQIRHRNIVPVLDVAEVTEFDPALKVIELIMPFYERGSVCDALLRGERFSVGAACQLLQGALAGIGELHERWAILHRDVKSPNVFLADDGSLLKVGDLGVAVPMDDHGRAEALQSAQLYSPPETFTHRIVDRRSDLYSLGLVFFELLNGPLPYEAYSRTDMERRLFRGRPAPVPRHLVHGPHVPKRLRAIVSKATAVVPGQRFSSAHEMSAAVAAAPLVDWSQVTVEDDLRAWEGSSAVRRDRMFRVEARLRRKGWVLTGLQRVNQWQRVIPDQIVADVNGPETATFFDKVVSVAISR